MTLVKRKDKEEAESSVLTIQTMITSPSAMFRAVDHILAVRGEWLTMKRRVRLVRPTDLPSQRKDFFLNEKKALSENVILISLKERKACEDGRRSPWISAISAFKRRCKVCSCFNVRG